MYKYLVFLAFLYISKCNPVDVYDIAFIGQTPNPDHILFMDADGTLSDPFFLPDGAEVYRSGQNSLNWSKDGERLVFASNIEGNLDIYSIKYDCTDFRRITSDAARDESPEYSPEGDRVVFLSDRHNAQSSLRDIYFIDLNTSVETRLSPSSGYYLSPTWHPDGVKVFYGVASATKITLNEINVANGQTNHLADLPLKAQGLRASPDGQKITFYTFGIFGDIFVINANGSNLRNLTETSDDQFSHPSWYKDDQLLYAMYGPNEGIYKMKSSGSSKTLIGNYFNAAWSPVFRFEKIITCADFDDLTVEDRFTVGNMVPAEIEFLVGDFVWGNGQTTSSGFVRVDNRGYAGGAKNDINTNNVNIEPQHAFPVDSISFRFAELGGNNNITLNGEFRNVPDLIELNNTTISGVTIEVIAVQNGSNWYGRIKLSGNISSFSIGGQELWIDNYCFDTFPLP